MVSYRQPDQAAIKQTGDPKMSKIGHPLFSAFAKGDGIWIARLRTVKSDMARNLTSGDVSAEDNPIEMPDDDAGMVGADSAARSAVTRDWA